MNTKGQATTRAIEPDSRRRFMVEAAREQVPSQTEQAVFTQAPTGIPLPSGRWHSKIERSDSLRPNGWGGRQGRFSGSSPLNVEARRLRSQRPGLEHPVLRLRADVAVPALGGVPSARQREHACARSGPRSGTGEPRAERPRARSHRVSHADPVASATAATRAPGRAIGVRARARGVLKAPALLLYPRSERARRKHLERPAYQACLDATAGSASTTIRLFVNRCPERFCVQSPTAPSDAFACVGRKVVFVTSTVHASTS